MTPALRKWLPALAPALILLLLGIQVFFGLRGFARPHGGPLGALELPGRLLGWGGVAMLLPLCIWLLLGWWGKGVTGMALKMLGAVTLGLAVGALAALALGESAGGRVGGPLATLLGDALGTAVAAVLLLLMAVPGALLASARFQLGPAPASVAPRPAAPSLAAPRPAAPGLAAPLPAAPGLAAPRPAAPGLAAPRARVEPLEPAPPTAERAKGWYPQRRFDAQGNELPMDFGPAKDVGSIRFRDAGSPTETTAAAAPPDPREPATETGWPRGLVAPPEDAPPSAHPEPAPPAPPPAVAPEPPPPVRSSVPNAVDRLRPDARVPGRPPTSGASAAAEDARPAKVFARSLFPKNPGDPVLIPGVRFRDEPPAAADVAPTPAPPPAAPAPPPVSEPAVVQAPVAPSARTGRTAKAKGKGKPGKPAAAQALPPPTSRLGDAAGMATYRTRLEASGIFGAPGATADAAPTPAPAARSAPSRPAPAPPEAAHAPAPRETAPAPATKPPARARGRGKAAADESAGLFAGAASTPPAAPKGRPRAAWVAELKDDEFFQAVEAAVERGSASPVLLTRRMGLGYARAQALIERLALGGVLGEVGPNGARPVLITRDELNAARS